MTKKYPWDALTASEVEADALRVRSQWRHSDDTATMTQKRWGNCVCLCFWLLGCWVALAVHVASTTFNGLPIILRLVRPNQIMRWNYENWLKINTICTVYPPPPSPTYDDQKESKMLTTLTWEGWFQILLQNLFNLNQKQTNKNDFFSFILLIQRGEKVARFIITHQPVS